MTNETVKFKHFIDDDGNTFNMAMMNGYNVGGKVLENVLFEIHVQENGDISVNVRAEDADYFSTLNEAKWLKEVKTFAINYDIFTVVDTNGEMVEVYPEYIEVANPVGKVNIGASTLSKIGGLFADDEDSQVETPITSVTETNAPKVAPNSRIAGLLDDIEEAEKATEEAISTETKVQNAFDMMPVEQKIQTLYDKALAAAHAKDADEIIATYVEDMYHPQNSQLAKNGDTANLYFNLLLLTRLQELEIMDFDFDEDVNSVNNAEYTLAHEFWADIMNSEMDTASKHVKVLDKNFRAMFYTAMFQAMVKDSDPTTYNNTKRKWSSFLSDDDTPTQTLEEGVIEYVKGKTVEGSMVMVTPDITPYFQLDEVNTETLVATDGDGDQQIKYVGKWEGRKVYEINVSKISYLKGFKRGAFFMKSGNKFLINPAKPLGYFHVIDNMFLTKPSLKMYLNMDIKIFNSSSTFLRIEDM
jgi:hypothetical protein